MGRAAKQTHLKRPALMFVLDPEVKQDHARFWALSDRLFFGNGACHILAGIYLDRFPESNYRAIWIKPCKPFRGNHIFVTNGELAFDHRGYSGYDRLIEHHDKGWSSHYEGWRADLMPINFSLLDTVQLNTRNMRGPDQYAGNVLARAERFLDCIDHEKRKAATLAKLRGGTN